MLKCIIALRGHQSVAKFDILTLVSGSHVPRGFDAVFVGIFREIREGYTREDGLLRKGVYSLVHFHSLRMCCESGPVLRRLLLSFDTLPFLMLDPV